MEGLGRLFNIIPIAADSVYVNMTNCGGVTFIGVKSGGDTYTVQSAAAKTGEADLDVITHWYENANPDGSTGWTKHADQTADAAVVSTAYVVSIYVPASSMPNGHKYLICKSTSTGLVYAIKHDLHVQRAPQNLPAAAA